MQPSPMAETSIPDAPRTRLETPLPSLIATPRYYTSAPAIAANWVCRRAGASAYPLFRARTNGSSRSGRPDDNAGKPPRDKIRT